MTRFISAIGVHVGIATGILAIFGAPWANFGNIGVHLTDYSGWLVHAAGATLLYVGALWMLFAGWRDPTAVPPTARILVTGGALIAGTSAVTMIATFNDPSDIFAGPAPMVRPGLGPGGALALVAIALTVGSLILARARAGRPAPFPPQTSRASAGSVVAEGE